MYEKMFKQILLQVTWGKHQNIENDICAYFQVTWGKHQNIENDICAYFEKMSGMNSQLSVSSLSSTLTNSNSVEDMESEGSKVGYWLIRLAYLFNAMITYLQIYIKYFHRILSMFLSLDTKDFDL